MWTNFTLVSVDTGSLVRLRLYWAIMQVWGAGRGRGGSGVATPRARSCNGVMTSLEPGVTSYRDICMPHLPHNTPGAVPVWSLTETKEGLRLAKIVWNQAHSHKNSIHQIGQTHTKKEYDIFGHSLTHVKTIQYLHNHAFSKEIWALNFNRNKREILVKIILWRVWHCRVGNDGKQKVKFNQPEMCYRNDRVSPAQPNCRCLVVILNRKTISLIRAAQYTHCLQLGQRRKVRWSIWPIINININMKNNINKE